MIFYWDPKEKSTKQHPVKKIVQHIREVRSC